MLHIEAVAPGLKRTLDALMSWRELDKFCLVGGTSLALRTGYRESDDIDLFPPTEYDSDMTSRRLEIFLQGCEIQSVSEGSITAYHEGLKQESRSSGDDRGDSARVIARHIRNEDQRGLQARLEKGLL